MPSDNVTKQMLNNVPERRVTLELENIEGKIHELFGRYPQMEDQLRLIINPLDTYKQQESIRKDSNDYIAELANEKGAQTLEFRLIVVKEYLRVFILMLDDLAAHARMI